MSRSVRFMHGVEKSRKCKTSWHRNRFMQILCRFFTIKIKQRNQLLHGCRCRVVGTIIKTLRRFLRAFCHCVGAARQLVTDRLVVASSSPAPTATLLPFNAPSRPVPSHPAVSHSTQWNDHNHNSASGASACGFPRVVCIVCVVVVLAAAASIQIYTLSACLYTV